MSLLQHYATFIAVAEESSFTVAANRLNLTKGAVSQAIKQLENSLKVALFSRNTRKVSLTEEGQLLYNQCVRIQKELETTEELMHQFHSSPSGKLRICCNPHFAKARLMTIIQEYMATFPAVSIDLLCDERMPDMHAEQIDIVFGINWPAPLDVVRKVVGHTRYVLCGSPSYFKKYGMPECIEDLERHHYVPHLGRDPNTPLMHLKTNKKIKLDIRLALNNISVMKSIAINGIGIVQLHDYIVEQDVQSGKLIEVLPELSTPDVPLYVYYLKQRFVQPKVHQFINTVAKQLNTQWL